MKRLMAGLLSIMLILTAHSGIVQAEGNDTSTVSEQHYTRIGEDYDILNENMLLSKKDGTLWTWNFNDYPPNDSDSFYQAKLMKISGMQDVKQIEFEAKERNNRLITNYVALKKDGNVWYWDSRRGAFLTPADAPTPIKDLNNVTSLVADFFVDYKTLFVLKSDGSVWSWGSRMNKSSSASSQTKLLDDVVSLKSANGVAYAVKKDGSVWKWRTSSFLPQNQNRSKNKDPEQITGLTDIINIEPGDMISYAYKQDGTVWFWRTNDTGNIAVQLHKATGARGIVQLDAYLKDPNIDTTYALKTDDQLWSVGNEQVFSGLTNIASVYHQGFNSKRNYVLKKDQTLWAWKDSYTLPKLVVFFMKDTPVGIPGTKATGNFSEITEASIDNRSGTTDIPTSNPTGTTSKPTGNLSETTSKTAGNPSEATTWPAIRTSLEMNVFPFITMLQPGQQQIIAASNVLPGTTITYTIDDPSIGTLSKVNGVPVVTAIKSGQTIVQATATRAGVPDETTYFWLYVVDGSTLPSTYFTAVQAIPEADKQKSFIVEGLTQAGELMISAASIDKLNPVNGQFVISSDVIDRLASNASNVKSTVKQTLSENKIALVRELIVNAEIVTVPNQNEYTFKLYKNGLIGRKDIDYITVYAGEARLVLNVATTDRLFQSFPVIVIHLVKENNGGYRVQFFNGQGQELPNVPSNIGLILPTNQPDDTNISVFYQNGSSTQPIGGKFNSSKNGMEAEISRSGTYFVSENSKSFPDVDGQDPELQQAVQFLGSKGIVTGKGKGGFEPDSLLTRAEFTAMLVRAFYALDETATESFSDVEPPQWHHPYIASSEKKHIVEGYPDGTFKPDRTISREEMTAIGARYLHEKKHYFYPSNPEDYLNQFVDKKTISNWAKPTMSLAVKQRLIDVPANKQIKAREAVTRGEATRMLYRLYLQL
ncbi:S-layer homology domain-containing protein [Paenibacillus sp.]|jgi:hypothetical protein|uniref:S-layer homology domain-containing protein n=1 Tax=Paenibacillus sp. TaxID=58172 RepID=UPI0028260E3B|nr:S-layer homology domain-containing protein [Paenibacillus sp.]MDR0270332.1 S-layer homology domain-containing protein [Paenibacillus sp.]